MSHPLASAPWGCRCQATPRGASSSDHQLLGGDCDLPRLQRSPRPLQAAAPVDLLPHSPPDTWLTCAAWCSEQVSETELHSDTLGAHMPDTRASVYKGSLAAYLAAHPARDAADTILVSYHHGVAAGAVDKESAVESLPALRCIVDSGIPAFFTQVDAAEAVAAETGLMAHVLGAR